MSDQSNRQERERLQNFDRWLVEEIVPYLTRDVPGEVDEMQAYPPSNELANQFYQSNSPQMISTTTESPPADFWIEGNDYSTEAGYSQDGRYPVQTSSVAGYQAQTPLMYDAEPLGHVEQEYGIAYAQSRPTSRELEEGWHQHQPGVWEWLGQGAPPGYQETQPQPARNTQASGDEQNLNQEAYARVSAPSSQRYSSPSVQLVTTPSQFLSAIDHSPRSWENMTNASDSQSEDQNHSVAGDGQRVSGNHRGDQRNARRAHRRRKP
ncbi:hypothetical protein BCON_0337g00080 [Botryotinia convoluta]|uniref:Uncharacterized protein n=1 Tax=Botryotinia convoluta TaxID=54673 RepID=A0A4Z1HBJ5_9HELO|nr:hypothetical protein BCON_0337g00080 [Botryotinia convoluta]